MIVRAVLSGLTLQAGLIVAIGAQNAYILRQGIKKQYVLAIALICTAIDWGLITIATAGFGSLVASFPLLTTLIAWAGAAFLLVYGVLAFRSALRPTGMDVSENGQQVESLKSAVLVALAVSLLNPHVYVDAFVLIGGIAGQYPQPERALFGLGAGLASAIWFFMLGYGARILAPLFRKPAAWRVLDVLVGIVMWWIAGSLILSELAHI